MRKFAFIFASLTLAFNASAAWYDDVRLGNPEYGGTGCPGGSAAVAVADDAKSLSILFDSFVVEAGGDTGKSFNRKICNIAVPVHIPQGYSVSIFQIDYRGFNSLPYGAYSQFRVEYFFAGSEGPAYEKKFRGRLEDEYLIQNAIAASAVTWSDCGQSVILRANTSMFVRSNSLREDALATVDSADVRAGLVFNLQWRRCTQNN
ncbi:MAG: DUF4360 domain-containing protein [Myxococcales bacterium]|nr:MAG: DUF4360 domain-containing protein [Myxococcales bacterium]